MESAYAKVETLTDYYRDNYPTLYSSNLDKIERAVDKLREIATLTTFPEMMVDWNTHADHSGHNKPPDDLMAGSDINFDAWRTNKSEGCFRCHGTLVPASGTGNAGNTQISVTPSGDSAEPVEYIDASCNLCHYTSSSQTNSPLPKAIPHSIERLDDCLLCHGESALKPYPEDHPWSTNAACTTCHAVAPLTSLPTFKPPTDLSKYTSHPTTGLEECLLCHEESAPASFGTDHPWSTNETCSACHNTAPILLPLPNPTPVPTTIPPIPHATQGLENCLLCHGASAPAALDTDHPWTSNETCSVCHIKTSNVIPMSPDPEQIPAIPHSIDGLTDCRLCHDMSGQQPYPSNHISIPTSFCTLCHQE